MSLWAEEVAQNDDLEQQVNNRRLFKGGAS